MISATLGSSDKFGDLVDRYSCAEFAQALFPLIVASSDDFGRLEASPQTLKRRVFQVSPRSIDEFQRALEALNEVDLIQLYKIEGKQYLQIVRFEEHQLGLHKRTQSRIPGPPPRNSRQFPEIPSEEKRTEENRTTAAQRARARSGDPGEMASNPQTQPASAKTANPHRVEYSGKLACNVDAAGEKVSDVERKTPVMGGNSVKQDRDPAEHWAVLMHRDRFGEVATIYAQEQMAVRVTDREVWKAVLEIWACNGHRAFKVHDMLDRYDRELAKKASPLEQRGGDACGNPTGNSRARETATDRNSRALNDSFERYGILEPSEADGGDLDRDRAAPSAGADGRRSKGSGGLLAPSPRGRRS